MFSLMKALTLNGYPQPQSVYTYEEESHKRLNKRPFYSIVRHCLFQSFFVMKHLISIFLYISLPEGTHKFHAPLLSRSIKVEGYLRLPLLSRIVKVHGNFQVPLLSKTIKAHGNVHVLLLSGAVKNIHVPLTLKGTWKFPWYLCFLKPKSLMEISM